MQEAAIKNAQDVLRALILDPASPDVWTVVFEPTDAPSFDARAIDVYELAEGGYRLVTRAFGAAPVSPAPFTDLALVPDSLWP